MLVYEGFLEDIDGLVQDCSNSSALAMELLQSCTNPLIWFTLLHWHNMNIMALHITGIFHSTFYIAWILQNHMQPLIW